MISERYKSDPAYRAQVDAVAARCPVYPESDDVWLRQHLQAGLREVAAEADPAAAS